jgi:hypothetical protein
MLGAPIRGPCRATVPGDAGPEVRGGLTTTTVVIFLKEGDRRWGNRGYPCARSARYYGSRPRASATGRSVLPPLRTGMSVEVDVDTEHTRGLPHFLTVLFGIRRDA